MICSHRVARNNVITQSLNHSITGLTLVELLMAATVFSILLMGLSPHLRGSVMVWRQTTSTAEQLQHTRVAFDRLGQDLSNAFLFDPTGSWTPPPLFAADRLQFYTVRPSWAVPKPSDQIWFVTYELSQTDEGTTALLRSAQTVREVASSLSGTSAEALAPLEGWSIRYGYVPEEVEPEEGAGPPPSLQWLAGWNDLTHLPKLVEVSATFGEGSAFLREIRQIFIIPSGSVQPSEESS